jgi:DNA primase
MPAWSPSANRRAAGVYDRFRHRVMFPIRDERGRMAGFGARILNPEDVPKFLNSPQTPLRQGPPAVRAGPGPQAIRAQDQVVIVEGYLDVIALHQAGFTNVVSPMGTALTEHQLYLLKRSPAASCWPSTPTRPVTRPPCAAWSRPPGHGPGAAEMVFDAARPAAHEARLQADIRVTTLPDGMDPDDVVCATPGRVAAHPGGRPPGGGARHGDPGRRARPGRSQGEDRDRLAQVLPLIEDVPSPVERDTYRQRLARLLGLTTSAKISSTPDTRPSCA